MPKRKILLETIMIKRKAYSSVIMIFNQKKVLNVISGFHYNKLILHNWLIFMLNVSVGIERWEYQYYSGGYKEKDSTKTNDMCKRESHQKEAI